MVQINLGNEAKEEIKRELIADDSYEAKIVEISDIFESPMYEDKTKTEEKLSVQFDINGKKIPLFMKAVISSGGGKYTPSKLHTFLSKAQLIDEVSKHTNIMEKNEEFVKYLKSKLMGKTFKFTTRTVNEGKDTAYSVVKEVIKLVG